MLLPSPESEAATSWDLGMLNGSRRLGSEWKQEIGKVAIVLRRS